MSDLPEYPQSREELWMNEIAGHLFDTEPEDPQSRIEKWLKYIAESGSGEGIPEAPIDGEQYARKDGAWSIVEGGSGDVEIVTLDDGDETLAELKVRIDDINEAGRHVFFDTGNLLYPLYLCTIAINYEDDVPVSYRLNDLVSGKTSIGSYDPDKTLSEILSEATSALCSIIVTCNTQDGVTVTGQTVTLRNGTSATDPIYDTAEYNGQPVTFVVPLNFMYHISVSDTLAGHFNPTVVTGTTTRDVSAVLTYSDVSNISKISDMPSVLKLAKSSQSIRDALVGVELDDDWEDTALSTSYEIKWIVLGCVDTYKDEDGDYHIITDTDPLPPGKAVYCGCKMGWKWCTPFDVQFDAPEGVECDSATETTAIDGVYYYGLAIGKTSKTAADLTLLELSSGDAIPYSEYEKVYKSGIRDTTKNSLQYGYSRASHSGVFQYLNSDGIKNTWWEEKHVGDVKNNIASTKDGFMRGCSEEILEYAAPIKLAVALNTVTDSDLGSYELVPCKFFLPSLEEMYGQPQLADVEGPYMPYWKRATELSSPNNSANDGRKIYAVNAQSSPQGCWLSSAFRGSSYDPWSCGSSGQLIYGYYGAFNSYRLAPDCVIVQSE